MRWLMVLMICASLGAVDESEAVKRILAAQSEAWNRGDLEAFVSSYENSPGITFVGREVERGYAQVLARYQRNYGTPEKRGQLHFEELEVRLLGKDHALVLGKFVLTRNPAGGGNASGRFTLVARKLRGQGWKILHDHTSSL